MNIFKKEYGSLGTDCENQSFQNIENEISENDWVHCFLRDGKFEGDFEYHPSGFYHLGRPELPDDKIILHTNVMNTTLREEIRHAKYLSDLNGGGNIYFYYNATHSIFMDATECAMGMNHIATEPVRGLVDALRYCFEDAPPDRKALVVFHSQGGINVTNALLCCPDEIRERVIAVGLASAKYVYKETCYQSVHYRAKPERDPIGYIDQRGSRRERNSIVTLNSHPNAPLHDHDFQSPTYRDAIKFRLNKYITYGE